MESQNIDEQEKGSRKMATSVSERELLINEETVELTYELKLMGNLTAA